MKRIGALFAALLLALGAFLPAALGDGADLDYYYTLYDEQDNRLCLLNCHVSPGDEYIAADNALYRVLYVREEEHKAVAEYVGQEESPLVRVSSEPEKQRLVAMYVTHSDESYEPSDGTFSDEERGGIYDVAGWLKENLEAQGVTVILDESTHFPHDSGAYDRSRATAMRLLQQMPAAIFDIHRDGIPAEEYETEIDGEEATKVRLLVGRSNPNADANRAFAKLVKAVADEKYPDLVKDIFIGKGNYNQELAPNSLLLEFGTHESDKEDVRVTTEAMAEVLNAAVFGMTAAEEEPPVASPTEKPQSEQKTPVSPEVEEAQQEVKKSRGMSAVWWILAGVGLLVVFGLAASGNLKGIGRTISEMTGGLLGKKPKDGQKK